MSQRNKKIKHRETKSIKQIFNNATKLYDKRTDIINAFVNKDIKPKNPEVKLYEDPEE